MPNHDAISNQESVNRNVLAQSWQAWHQKPQLWRSN
jgi:hypothetical protein